MCVCVCVCVCVRRERDLGVMSVFLLKLLHTVLWMTSPHVHAALRSQEWGCRCWGESSAPDRPGQSHMSGVATHHTPGWKTGDWGWTGRQRNGWWCLKDESYKAALSICLFLTCRKGGNMSVSNFFLSFFFLLYVLLL